MSEIKQHQWVGGAVEKKSDWEVGPYQPYQAPLFRYVCNVCGKSIESKTLVILNQLAEINESCPGLPCVACNGRGTVSEENSHACVICHGDGRMK